MNIYYYNINEFNNLDDAKFLTEKRREKFEHLRHYEDKARCLAGGLLMRRFLNITDDSQIAFGTNGKPYLKDNSVFFNLSHSGDYVVLAVADCEVGVDIEQIKPNRENVAKRFFTPEENEWLIKMNHPQAFFDIWTAKEAVMKVTGQGMALSPASFCVLPFQDGAHVIQQQPLYLYWNSLDGYALCAAAQKPQSMFQLIPVNYHTLIENFS